MPVDYDADQDRGSCDTHTTISCFFLHTALLCAKGPEIGFGAQGVQQVLPPLYEETPRPN